MTNSTAHPGGGNLNISSTGSATLSIGSISRPEFVDYDCRFSAPVLLAVVGGYSVVSLLGLLGNLCLLCMIWCYKETQNVSNILISNLAASDTLVCVICIPFTVVYTLMDHWLFGEVMCKVTGFVQCLSVSVSSFSLVLIAGERHQLIVNPRGWKPSVTHAHWGIAGIWLGSAVLSLPYLVVYHLTDEPFRNISHGFYRDKYACVDGWPSERSRLGFNTCLLLMQYVAPLCFILVCYRRVLACLRKRRDRQRDSEARVRETKRINSLLVSIVATFVACWLPLNVFNQLFDWHHKTLLGCHHNLLFILCHIAAMVSTCINPVFYGFLNKNLQKDLQMRLGGLCSSPEVRNNVGLSVIQTGISKSSPRLSNSTSAC